MKIGYIILCRYNSSRLPGKILREINGEPLLQILIERLAPLKKENIIVATSVEATDDAIVNYCLQNNINVFRGSLNDVAGRFLECAQQFNLDYAVRVNGDNLFADPYLIQEIANFAVANLYDFVSNVPNRTYPVGLSVEVVNVDFFKKAYAHFNDEKYHEHVTLFLYENLDKAGNYHFIENKEYLQAKGDKLAIDTAEDIALAENIINKLGKDYLTAGWKEVVKLKQLIA